MVLFLINENSLQRIQQLAHETYGRFPRFACLLIKSSIITNVQEIPWEAAHVLWKKEIWWHSVKWSHSPTNFQFNCDQQLAYDIQQLLTSRGQWKFLKVYGTIAVRTFEKYGLCEVYVMVVVKRFKVGIVFKMAVEEFAKVDRTPVPLCML